MIEFLDSAEALEYELDWEDIHIAEKMGFDPYPEAIKYRRTSLPKFGGKLIEVLEVQRGLSIPEYWEKFYYAMDVEKVESLLELIQASGGLKTLSRKL